jgi:predicted metal-binding membrane protein
MPFTMMPQSDMMSFGVAAIVSSTSLTSISIFEIVWIIGMAAMMFPAMIPIVLFYNKVATKQELNPYLAKSVGTSLFLGGYLAVYAALGICAYLAIYEAISLSTKFSSEMLVVIASSSILIATGIYQFTPLKSRCLKNCVSPIGFFAVHYRSGLLGTLRMGLTHGYYCVGCCWTYMLVMLGVGAMSIPVMAVLTGIIALEKVLARAALWFNRLVAFGFISIGLIMVVFPAFFAHL